MSDRVRQFSRTRGQVLVLMIPLAFAFFALAALVIDLGVVRATQSRMNVACDTAALETLRWRDETPLQPTADATPPAPETRDANRRDAAARLCENAFADPTFDAGPQFDVQATGEDQATIQPRAAGYRPQSKVNATNDPAGDVVAGAFSPLASHAENSAYDRADFAANADVRAAADAPAALVRLRRLRENLRDGENADVSSTGASLPLLFGRGSVVVGGAAGGEYSARRDGFSVRSTAIANAGPAVAVCPGQTITTSDGTSVTLQGGQPVALSVAFWNSLAAVAADGAATPTPVTPGVNGTLTSGGAIVGHLWHAAPATAAGWITIGTPTDDVPPATAGDAVLRAATQGYFAIYEAIDDGAATPTDRIVGFGYARWDPATNTITKLAPVAYDPDAKTYTAAKGYVAPQNATADLSAAWPTLGAFAQPAELQAVLSANGRAVREPVYAATLGRAIGD